MKPVNKHELLETCSEGLMGRDPRTLEISALNKAGFFKQPVLQAIRAKCIDCCGGSAGEARKCTATGCALWPYRMGMNPFAMRELTEEQRRDAAARLRKSRTG